MIYSTLKPAWHLDRIAALRTGEPVVPVQVQLVISDLCNQNCHFCAYRWDAGLSSELYADPSGNRNPKRFIDYGKAREILRDCRALGVKAIQFTGGGEPTVHPQAWPLFALAQELDLETGLVTNGAKINVAAHAGVLTDFAWIRVSVDAGNAATYADLRESDRFTIVWGNLAELSELAGRGTLGVGFVVTRENHAEIAECCRRARDIGVDYVRISAVFSRLGNAYFNGLEFQIQASIQEALNVATPEFQVINLFNDRHHDLDGGVTEPRCGYQRMTAYIGADLHIYRCCNTAYTSAGRIGDLTNMRFYDWFNQGNSVYEPFDARSCQYCQFKEHNRLLAYLSDPAPQHVSFT